MYINSNKINIFPLSKPRTVKNNRLFYEENVANLIRQVVDSESFIIEAPEVINDYKLTQKLLFNIYGYYFKIEASEEEPILISGANTTSNYIIAQIKLTDSDSALPQELEGQDNNNSFEGLELIYIDNLRDISEDTTVKSLVLFKKENNKWKVNKDAFFKFQLKSLIITGIDGKH